MRASLPVSKLRLHLYAELQEQGVRDISVRVHSLSLPVSPGNVSCELLNHIDYTTALE